MTVEQGTQPNQTQFQRRNPTKTRGTHERLQLYTKEHNFRQLHTNQLIRNTKSRKKKN